MPDQTPSSLPFESADPAEQKLWSALEDLPREEPSPQLRRAFYDGLENASQSGLAVRLREWLGFGNNMGWLTAAACLVLGFGLSQALLQPGSTGRVVPTEDGRLAALEQNVALLNRELIMVRLNADDPGLRLQGVVQASTVAATDNELTSALLTTALSDRSLSVRSAAIDALGPRINDEALGGELMQFLEQAESPIVQLALVDLVLRNGNTRQVAHLRMLAEEKRLYADIVTHVLNALGAQTA